MFLDRVIYQIQKIKGYTTMGENHIERAYQRRHQITSLGATNQNKMVNMKIQEKYERVRYIEKYHRYSKKR